MGMPKRARANRAPALRVGESREVWAIRRERRGIPDEDFLGHQRRFPRGNALYRLTLPGTLGSGPRHGPNAKMTIS